MSSTPIAIDKRRDADAFDELVRECLELCASAMAILEVSKAASEHGLSQDLHGHPWKRVFSSVLQDQLGPLHSKLDDLAGRVQPAAKKHLMACGAELDGPDTGDQG